MPAVKIDSAVLKLKAVSQKIHGNLAERQTFLQDPEKYLKANGIAISKNLINLGSLNDAINNRHDPGRVAVCV